MFWGDRYGQVTDPFGHRWSIATKKKDMTPEEMGAAAKAAMAAMAKPGKK
jgi:PhnB protein